MKIISTIYNDWSKEQRSSLKKLNIDIEVGYNRINIEENERNIEALKLIDTWGIKRYVSTTYEKKDYEDCSMFVYVGVWENGYPMPDNDAGYINLTYDTKEYCKVCDIGKRQKSPFRLKSAPKWKNKFMFELNWVYDEIFVKNDIYEGVFKNLGVKSREVLLYKEDSIIKDTVQLEIPKVDIPLKLKYQPSEICPTCNRRRYSPQIKGFFPPFEKPIPRLQIFKCSEYFGSGGEAHNKIFVTRELLEKLKGEKIKPTIWPVAPHSFSPSTAL